MKSPRQYASDYLAAGADKAKQKAALAGCPVEYRAMVNQHIRDARLKQSAEFQGRLYAEN